MFLQDFANTALFSNDDDKKKKPGMLGTARNLAIGKTLPGMLTRAAAVGTVGTGLYGRHRFKKMAKKMNPYHLQHRMNRYRKHAMDVGKTALGTTAGVGVGGAGLMAAKNEYDRRNRKWWEIL